MMDDVIVDEVCLVFLSLGSCSFSDDAGPLMLWPLFSRDGLEPQMFVARCLLTISQMAL